MAFVTQRTSMIGLVVNLPFQGNAARTVELGAQVGPHV